MLALKTINESLHQSAEVLENVAQTVVDMSGRSEKRMEHIKELSNSIIAIKNGAEELSEVVDIVKEVNSDTHLLSLNTAIQSAHLKGDLGKPFSVIANEMTKLSKKSAESVKVMDKKFKETIDACENVLKIVHTAIGGVESNNTDLQDLSAMVEQLSATIEEISGSLAIVAKKEEEFYENKN